MSKRLPRPRWLSWAALMLGLLAAAVAAVWLAAGRPGSTPGTAVDTTTRPVTVGQHPNQAERGAYLARAGHCAGCHTARGGAHMAGGRPVATPFGTVFSSNLTPDAEHGLGRWTAADFARALHEGLRPDGRMLNPVCPYPNFTWVSTDDALALWAWLQSLPAVPRATPPSTLRFPYNNQAALAVWRALYFRPQRYLPDPGRDAAWNRGAYLVGGLGHCAACHSPRNFMGATGSPLQLGGGHLHHHNWYAPALDRADQGGVAAWPLAEVVALLKTGTSTRATTLGPMAEVVMGSTQHLSEQDLQAMAVFLQSLPERGATLAPAEPAASATLQAGAALYDDHCASCHGTQGQGAAPAYPALAGNRAVGLVSHQNVVKSILEGGFAPATAGHARPFGMPPFAHVLDDTAVAAIATYLRQSWGHRASPVSPQQVQALR